MSSPVIVVPDSVQKVLGQDGACALVDVVGQVAATKVDKSDLAAFTSAVDARFGEFDAKLDKVKAELKSDIDIALLKGVVWVVGTILTGMGLQTAILSNMIRGQ